MQKLTIKNYNSNATIFGKNTRHYICYSGDDLQLYGKRGVFDNVKEAISSYKEDVTDELNQVFPDAENIDEIVDTIMIYVDCVINSMWECTE